ncbi:MAG: hypothetical protein L0J17_04055 [Brevibacterium sp.]|nr:hypothetical protein [Brevibacterium sp.]MDN5832766.1 hypothetical protein [Brevibacterium sp.]MDN5875399.1 hypothetical protein [Brevibacterium sp.]MDN5908567.1 hypothetical protein [Brevibacterium sp.]MDN6133077.1 hypothetical protein [Brevibacterium sp.]
MREPFGNIRRLQSRVTDVEADDLAASAADPANLVAMKYVQDSLAEALR